MVTIEQAANALGLTPRQVYRRISSARSLLAPYIRRGQNGALLLDGGAIEILRRAEDLRKAGVTIEEALRQVAEEMSESEGRKSERAVGDPPESNFWKLLLQEKDARIAELRAQVERLTEENVWLRERLKELQRLALPAPRRRWWAWFVRRGTTTP